MTVALKPHVSIISTEKVVSENSVYYDPTYLTEILMWVVPVLSMSDESTVNVLLPGS